MNKKKAFYFCFILLPICFSELSVWKLNAQTVKQDLLFASGVIKDTENLPISFASVIVLTTSQPGKVFRTAACDTYGKFEIPLPKGKYKLKITCVGYKEQIRNIELDSEPIKLGQITLKIDQIQLDEVTIRPLVEKNAREVIYNITADSTRATSSMLDILGRVPFLSVIDDRIVAENDPLKSVIVLRNGRKDALFSGGSSLNEVLRKLPAMGFTNVKILLDKPEKYKEYDYVITVTPDKTQRLFGAVGESLASFRLDRNLNLSQRVTASSDKTRIASSIGYSWDKPLHTENISSTQGTNYSLLDNERIENKTDAYSGNINISRDLSARDFLSGSFSVKKRDNYTDRYGKTEFQSNEQPGSLTNNRTSSSVKNCIWEGALAYHLDIKPDKKELNASYVFKTSPTNTRQDQLRENTDTENAASTLKDTREHEYSHYFSLIYTDKLTPKLTLTGKGSWLMASNDRETHKYDTSFEEEIEDLNAYDYFKRPINRLDALLAVSWLATRNMNLTAEINPDYMLNTSKVQMISGTDEALYYKEQNWAFSSELSMRFLFKQKTKAKASASPFSSYPTQLELDYSIYQNRPSYIQLSNYVDDSNPNYIITGNPYLKNETLHSLSARLSHKKIGLNLSYEFSNNKIAHYWYQTENSRTVQSYTNDGLYGKLHLGINNMIWLNKDVRKMHFLTLYLNGIYTREKANKQNAERYFVMASAGHRIQLFKGYMVNTTLRYTKFWDSGYNGVDLDKPFSLNIMIDKSFKFKNSMRLHALIRCNDIFGWNRDVNAFINSDTFTRRQQTVSKRIPISLTLRLNFGSFRVKSVKQVTGVGEIGGFSKSKSNTYIPE